MSAVHWTMQGTIVGTSCLLQIWLFLHFPAYTEGDIPFDYAEAYDPDNLYEDGEVLGVEPVFDVPLVNVTVVAGQSALLPCSIKHLGKYKVEWSDKSPITLTLEDRRIVDDSRFSIVRPFTHAWNLQIRDVKWSDQGPYLCTLNTEPVISKTAMLYVKVPPTIIDSLSTNDVTVEEGDTVVLICNVTGIPHPTVTWYRSPTSMSFHGRKESKRCEPRALGPGIGLTGEMIIITNVTRNCDDTYECRASNGVRPDRKRQIRVTVEFPPEVRMPVEAIRQRRGRETILECKITGYPLAVTTWQRHGVDVEADPKKYRIEVYEDGPMQMSLNLQIKPITEEDFGEYTCVAKNAHGIAFGKMVLKEIPEITGKHRSTQKEIWLDLRTPTPTKNYYDPYPKQRDKENTINKDIAPVPVVDQHTSSQTNTVHVSLLTLWSALSLTVCVHYYQSKEDSQSL